MDLRRMNIRRMDDEVLAIDRESGIPYDILNPKDIPNEFRDGIFTVDHAHGTARFESCKIPTGYVHITKKRGMHHDPRRDYFTSFPDGTKTALLFDGKITVTKKGDEVFVDAAPGLSKDAMRFLAALVLEGYSLKNERILRALEVTLLGE